jgi:DNA-directed RNA polymerase specialized sigma subunit
MTTKEKKEYLKRYRKIDREVNQLLMEKDEIFSLGTKITPTYSDMPKGTGENNKTQSTIEKLEEQEEKINKKIDLLYEVKEDIEKALHTVEDDTLRVLLRYRYINGFTWEKIAVMMGYGYRNITRLHGKALMQIKIHNMS